MLICFSQRFSLLSLGISLPIIFGSTLVRADFRAGKALTPTLSFSQFNSQAISTRKTSTAPDGFKTSYLEIVLKGTKPQKTALLVHGLNVDGRYWFDFIQASGLLEQGYKILLPDLMARGQTKELNFPIKNPELREWQPNSVQAQWLKQLTPEQESDYLYHLLLNERAAESHPLPLLIAGHSRGSIVTANLIYRLGLENKAHLESLKARQNEKKKTKSSLLWDVEAHWNFNGLVMYHSDSVNFAIHSEKSREKVLNAFDAALEMRPGLNQLRDAEVNVGDDEEIRIDLEAQSRVKPILSSYQMLFDGPRENWLIDLLVTEFENSPDFQGYSRYANRGLYEREYLLSTAQVQGLRTVYKVNTNEQGKESFSSKNIMLPDSVIGIYRSIQKGNLPGIQSLYVIQGTRDLLVPTNHAKLLIPKDASVVPFHFEIFTEHDHYGPGDPQVRRLFRDSLTARNLGCIAIFH